MYFKVKLADLIIGIECIYDSTRIFCKDYIVGNNDTDESDIDFYVRVTEDDIKCELGRTSDYSAVNYRDEYIETLALQRKIADRMPEFDCFLMHGAVASVNGLGYMFTASSGTGKSTHVKLWKKCFDNVEIINGDKPFIRVSDKKIKVYGTPWAGKEGWQINKSVPLEAICLLRRGTKNRLRKMEPVSILSFLMRQVHYTDDPDMAGRTMELLSCMLSSIKVYELECDISKEAAECSYAITKNHNDKIRFP